MTRGRNGGPTEELRTHPLAAPARPSARAARCSPTSRWQRACIALATPSPCCTSTRYASLVTARGLGYGRLSDDLIALVETSEGREAIAAAGRAIPGTGALVKMIGRSLEIQRDLFPDGWTAAKEASPHVVTYHPKMAIALHYAERLGGEPPICPPPFTSSANHPTTDCFRMWQPWSTTEGPGPPRPGSALGVQLLPARFLAISRPGGGACMRWALGRGLSHNST